MRFQLFYLAVGCLCGYLMMAWMPNVTPFILTNFITDFTFHPLKSFLAMVCFFIGFLANAMVIRSLIEGVLLFLLRKPIKWREWIASYGIIGSFYWLFQLNERLTILFFIFSVAYAMISIDLERARRYKNNL
jgi:hypothetical protein